MNKAYINITGEGLKTLFNGAIGSMTFGMYHMYVTDQKMKMNNEIQEQKNEQKMKEQEQKMKEQEQRYEKQIAEIKEQLNKKRTWF